MKNRWVILFIRSAGALLIATAVAKFVSASGSAHVLQNLDPVFHISFRYMFLIAGAFEITVASVCILSKNCYLQTGLLLLISSNIALYRLSLWLVGWHGPCSCLGNLTDAIHVPPQVADDIMKGLLVYLLIGSCNTLLWLWRRGKDVKGVSASVLLR